MRDRLAIGFLLAAAGCAAPAYSPCPVQCGSDLPTDAFARCRSVLRQQYGELAVADESHFLIQSAWLPIADPPGERRASVFAESASPGELVVVVELRWLSIPWFGLPSWTDPRGDAAAERALAEALRDALAVPSAAAANTVTNQAVRTAIDPVGG